MKPFRFLIYRLSAVAGVTASAPGGIPLVQFRDKVLYHTGGECTDITDGVLALFEEKTKP